MTDTTKATILRAEHLGYTVALGREMLTILQSIDLEIKAGESLAIVGRSGSGKTTLLGMLAGLDVPTQGRVWMGDACISELDEDGRARLRARMVGFVFQSFQLLPALSALENVMLPLELQGDRRARTQATELLQRVGLGDRLHHTPRQLSGGEQQRVAIARAFASTPAILFADEPTGNLDGATGDHSAELLMQLNREHGTTLVMVTHDERLAARCQRVVHINNGVLSEAAVPSPVHAGLSEVTG
ncbi:MAG: ABC transporter ATP-binding protein [Gammaproteobacteria bacterium]|nr:ABC transporter ATP-binding protein [Gammaproteobacteria bacterium]